MRFYSVGTGMCSPDLWIRSALASVKSSHFIHAFLLCIWFFLVLHGCAKPPCGLFAQYDWSILVYECIQDNILVFWWIVHHKTIIAIAFMISVYWSNLIHCIVYITHIYTNNIKEMTLSNMYVLGPFILATHVSHQPSSIPLLLVCCIRAAINLYSCWWVCVEGIRMQTNSAHDHWWRNLNFLYLCQIGIFCCHIHEELKHLKKIILDRLVSGL